VTEATAQVEKLTDLNANTDGKKDMVEVKEAAAVRDVMSETPAFIANLLVMLILLYFLLASGDSFLRKLVAMIPKWQDKKRAVEITRDIEDKISKYLQITFGINACVGLAVGVASYFVGLQNYILWGVLAFLLNFVPYLGALVGAIAILAVGLMTFADTGHAFIMPGIYIVMNIIEGNFLTPMIMGRFMTLDPVAIFVFLMFWGWIWGIPGALLAVPILAVVKILCDHIEPLESIGAFLGGKAPPQVALA
jgi:predicted PurR-regulated permease PerM